MKKRVGVLLTILVITGAFNSFQVNAQIHTPDGDICKRNYSIYKGFYDNKEYEDAIVAWRITLKNCPTFSYNIYSHGVRMIKYFIEKETDIVHKEGLIDTLLMLYDMRIEHYGNNHRYPEGYILAEKGCDLLKYRKDDFETGYELLSRAIELWGNNSRPRTIITFMNVTSHLFRIGLIDQEEVLENYSNCMNIVEFNLEKEPDNEAYLMAKSETEKNFTNSGAADCNSLINLFKPKFEQNSDDLDLLKKINSYLLRYKCTDSEFFFNVTETLYKLEPTSTTAHSIAQRFMIREDYLKALEYLENAINIETILKDRGLYFYEMAQVLYLYKADYIKARTYARKAIEINPNKGEPYILIGKIYISAHKNFSDNEFEKSTVFWLAVDKFKKAKSVDPEVEEEATKLINLYSAYFPKSEDVFYRVLNVGDPYTVKGWINEVTRIRVRK